MYACNYATFYRITSPLSQSDLLKSNLYLFTFDPATFDHSIAVMISDEAEVSYRKSMVFILSSCWWTIFGVREREFSFSDCRNINTGSEFYGSQSRHTEGAVPCISTSQTKRLVRSRYTIWTSTLKVKFIEDPTLSFARCGIEYCIEKSFQLPSTLNEVSTIWSNSLYGQDCNYVPNDTGRSQKQKAGVQVVYYCGCGGNTIPLMIILRV